MGNTEQRRRISAAEIKRRKIRRRKIRMYKRLAVLFSGACLAIFLVIALISIIVNAFIGDKNKDNERDNINSNSTGNHIVDVGGNEHEQNQVSDNEENTSEQMTENEIFTYGDEMYNDGEFVVCVDPGHGGNDVGCIGVDGSYEKDDVLALARYVVKELESQGVKVVTTRATDVWVDLDYRPQFANEQKADLLLSIHRNTYEGNGSVKGFEAWVHSEDSDNSMELAEMIMDGLERVGLSKNRGAKKGSQSDSEENYKINNGSSMPSVLLEMGFMSSATDNKYFRDNAKDYANAIATAIIQWSQGKAY